MRIVNVSSEVGSISAQTDPGSPLSTRPTSAQYPSSKTALNMLTAMYAKELRDSPIKVNAANPGFTATDFKDHRGLRSAAEGAEPSVNLATSPDDGPSPRGTVTAATACLPGRCGGVRAYRPCAASQPH